MRQAIRRWAYATISSTAESSTEMDWASAWVQGRSGGRASRRTVWGSPSVARADPLVAALKTAAERRRSHPIKELREVRARAWGPGIRSAGAGRFGGSGEAGKMLPVFRFFPVTNFSFQVIEVQGVAKVLPCYRFLGTCVYLADKRLCTFLLTSQ